MDTSNKSKFLATLIGRQKKSSGLQFISDFTHDAGRNIRIRGSVVFVLVILLFIPSKAKAEWVKINIHPDQCRYTVNVIRQSGENYNAVYQNGFCFINVRLTDARCKWLFGQFAGLRNGQCVPVAFKYGGEPDDICKRIYGNQSWFSYSDNICKDAYQSISDAYCQSMYGPDYYVYQGRCVQLYPQPIPGPTPPPTPGPSPSPPTPAPTPGPAPTPTPMPTPSDPCPSPDECYDQFYGECVDKYGINNCN